MLTAEQIASMIAPSVRQNVARFTRYARLGKGNDSGEIVADRSEREVYIHEDNRPWSIVRVAHNISIDALNNPAYEEVRVVLGYPANSQREHVLDIEEGEGSKSLGGTTPNEALQHATLYSYVSNIVDGRIGATTPASTEVFVNAFWYFQPSTGLLKYFGQTQTTTITALLSALSTGQHQMAVVYLNTESGQIATTSNTAVTGTDRGDFDATTIENLLQSNPDYIYLGATHLVKDDTALEEGDDFYRNVDPRVVFNAPASHARIFVQTASVTVADTTTETTLTGAGQGNLTLPANFFTVGRTIRLKAMGVFSDTGTPTLNIRFKLGSTTICSTGAVALAGTIANNVWSVDIELTCRTVGASGTVIAQGLFTYDESTHAGTTEGLASTTTTTIDTTASQAVGITVQWGSASASNTITATNLTVERIG
jgi:hypothetical protein